MKNVSIASIMLAFSISSLNAVMQLPTGLYHIAHNNAEQTVTINTKNPIFYIVVPQSPLPPSKSKTMIQAVSQFTQSTTVPQNFFSNNEPTTPTSPITLFFDWKEQESNQVRRNAGFQLAKGINALKSRFKNAHIILVGHGQGGNVINSATHNLAQPIDVAIELATPIFPNSQQYAHYQPVKKMIGQLFTFYTEQAFATMNPTLHPRYENYRKKATDPNLKNVLMLVNNQHPLPYQMLSPTVGKRLLQLCQKIVSSYQNHNHLIAHLSTQKNNADMVVALYDNSIHNKATSPSQVGQERFKSRIKIKQLNKALKAPLQKTLNNMAKNRGFFKSITHSAEQYRNS